MTVQQLIEACKEYPLDMEVVIYFPSEKGAKSFTRSVDIVYRHEELRDKESVSDNVRIVAKKRRLLIPRH